MPNRLIREGLLDSEAIDALSAEAERFFVRLLLVADDAGRFTGRPDVIRGRLFPLKATVRDTDIARWLGECAAVGLVLQYQHGGKSFLQVARVHRSSPAKFSKSPWTDGRFEISFVDRETRDGVKQFVSTSLFDPPEPPPQAPESSDSAPIPPDTHQEGIGKGSDTHSDGIGKASPPFGLASTGTGTGTLYGDVDEKLPPTAAEALSDREVIFRLGKPLLVEQGSKAETAGSFLGGQIGKSSEAIVAQAIRNALMQTPPPVDLKSWLVASCQGHRKQSSRLDLSHQDHAAGWGPQ